jgi:hypothetical protein
MNYNVPDPVIDLVRMENTTDPQDINILHFLSNLSNDPKIAPKIGKNPETAQALIKIVQDYVKPEN